MGSQLARWKCVMGSSQKRAETSRCAPAPARFGRAICVCHLDLVRHC
jgi:hypothetical protein